VVAPAGAVAASTGAPAPAAVVAEPVVAPRADAPQPRASASTDLADDPWHNFIDYFNELAASAPAGGTTTRPLRRQADASPESASAFALQAARELREARARERTLEVAEANEQLRRRTERRAQVEAVERFPLSGLPVDDGCKYVGADFQPQLDLAERDEFLEVMGMPPLFDEPRARFAMAEASARHQLTLLGGGQPFKFGITRGPSARFHNREGSGIGPRGGYKGYFEEGYDGMVVIFCGPPNHCAELERRLIATHRPNRACQNSADGGEGKAPSGVASFVYMSWAKLGNFADLETKRKLRPPSLISRSRDCLARTRG